MIYESWIIYADHFQYNDTEKTHVSKPATRPARCIHIPPWVKPYSNVPWTTTAPRGPNWAVPVRPENTWLRWTNFLEVSETCWMASMCMHMCIYRYKHICMYLFMYLCDYLFSYLCVYLFMYIYMCVCFHGKIDKYDDVWWFSRKPYLISGGYGTKWNVLVAIIQHQMQKNVLELGLQVLHHITVLTRRNPLQGRLSHWTRLVWGTFEHLVCGRQATRVSYSVPRKNAPGFDETWEKTAGEGVSVPNLSPVLSHVQKETGVAVLLQFSLACTKNYRRPFLTSAAPMEARDTCWGWCFGHGDEKLA